MGLIFACTEPSFRHESDLNLQHREGGSGTYIRAVLWFVVDGKHGASETQDHTKARYLGGQLRVDRKVKFVKELRKECNMQESIGPGRSQTPTP